MTREKLIEAMATAIAKDDNNPATSKIYISAATAAFAAIEAQGLVTVPIKPSAAQLDCVCSDVAPWTDEIMAEVYRDMIEAGKVTAQKQTKE